MPPFRDLPGWLRGSARAGFAKWRIRRHLKLLVMSKSSDPRMGETTYKLTNLSRAEPDPALFQIPADYTVKEQPSGPLIFKDNR